MIRLRVLPLAAAVLAVLAAAPVAAAGTPPPGRAGAAESTTTTTPIKHLVFLMQENHTFDNYFGTRPGVDGIPTGTCVPVSPGGTEPCVRPFHLDSTRTIDIDHSAGAFDQEFRAGAMDGFVAVSRASGAGDTAMGHYDRTDLPYYWSLADQYALFDHFFSSSASGSVRNHLFAVTGQGGPAAKNLESIPPQGWGDLPTIFDELQARGISWKYYIRNYDPTNNVRGVQKGTAGGVTQRVFAPVTEFARFVDDPALRSHIVDLSQYYTDLADRTLPAVAYIAPSGNSEHPPGDVGSGESFARTLITELQRSYAWSDSAFLLSYDDWGGWYDHVMPPVVDQWGYGPRVPALLVSPYARRGYVDSGTYDFTSILKFIERNWKVPALASRDGGAATFLTAFDFGSQPRPADLGLSRPTGSTPPSVTRAVHRSYELPLAVFALFVVAVAVTPVVRSSRRRSATATRRSTSDVDVGGPGESLLPAPSPRKGLSP